VINVLVDDGVEQVSIVINMCCNYVGGMLQILCVPFILTDDKMGSLGDSKDVWVGSIDGRYAPMWCDFFVAQVQVSKTQNLIYNPVKTLG